MSDKPNLVHDAVLDSLRDELVDIWALADDLFAVLEMGCDNAERLRVMARYREARER